MATRNMGEPNEPREQMGTGAADLGSGSPPSLKEQAADLGRKAGEGVRQAASQAQSGARARIEREKQDAASTLSSVATTLLNSGLQLRDDRQEMAGEYVERAARQIERAAEYVQNTDLRQVVNEVEDFARRRPALFIGSAFAAGLLAARFLKSSQRDTRSVNREEQQPFYGDRDVTPRPAMETGRTGSDPATWQEPPL